MAQQAIMVAIIRLIVIMGVTTTLIIVVTHLIIAAMGLSTFTVIVLGITTNGEEVITGVVMDGAADSIIGVEVMVGVDGVSIIQGWSVARWIPAPERGNYAMINRIPTATPIESADARKPFNRDK